MSSQRKIASARANGAKSHGPSTVAGRKASSMNAVTHGMYSRGVVLQTESQDQHREMLDAYIQQFQPQGLAEFHLVEEMVAAKWRQRRLWAIETDFLDEETAERKATFEENGDEFNEITPLSRAYASFSARPSLPFLNRNESRLERAYFRALKSLLDLQRLRRPAATQKMQERTESQTRTALDPFTHHPPPTHQPPTTDNRQPTTDTPDHQPPTTNHRPPTTDHRPPTTDHRPPTTDNRQPDNRPPTTLT